MPAANAHSAADNIQIFCLVAALLATLSYTGVLSPPHAWADCQDICPKSILDLMVILQESGAYLGNSTLSPHNLNVTVDSLGNLQTLTDRSNYAIHEIVNSELPHGDEYRVVSDQGISTPLQIFLILNALSFFSSMACLLVAGVRSAFADSEDEFATIEQDCLLLVVLASTFLLLAFVIGNVQVFFSVLQNQLNWPSFGVLLGFSLLFAVIITYGCIRPLSPLTALRRQKLREARGEKFEAQAAAANQFAALLKATEQLAQIAATCSANCPPGENRQLTNAQHGHLPM